MPELPLWLVAFYGGLIGGALGSYLGAAYYRIPRRRSLGGRSHCPSCGTELKASWMVPVFSWLALRGRSACCEQRMSVSYLLWELGSVIVGATLAALLGLAWFVLGAVAVIFIVALIAALRVSRKTGP